MKVCRLRSRRLSHLHSEKMLLTSPRWTHSAKALVHYVRVDHHLHLSCQKAEHIVSVVVAASNYRLHSTIPLAKWSRIAPAPFELARHSQLSMSHAAEIFCSEVRNVNMGFGKSLTGCIEKWLHRAMPQRSSDDLTYIYLLCKHAHLDHMQVVGGTKKMLS